MKEAVVVLPYQNQKVLMQLRDQKPGIVYPGHWGFFGGGIESGETPVQCAKRELLEEIGYETSKFNILEVDCIEVPHKRMIHSFSCPLNIQIEEIQLSEGFDYGLFKLEDIRSKQLFSNQAQKKYPVVNHPIIENLVSKVIQIF